MGSCSIKRLLLRLASGQDWLTAILMDVGDCAGRAADVHGDLLPCGGRPPLLLPDRHLRRLALGCPAGAAATCPDLACPSAAYLPAVAGAPLPRFWGAPRDWLAWDSAAPGSMPCPCSAAATAAASGALHNRIHYEVYLQAYQDCSLRGRLPMVQPS